MLVTVYSEEEMISLGGLMARVLEKNDVVYLIGELGAGKTTLVRGITRGLGYTGRVTSPTFTLMNIYAADIDIFHFDFYRLQGNDLSDLGLEEYLEKDGLSLIEWPQIADSLLPPEALLVNIELVEEDYERERLVMVTARGQRYQAKVEELKVYANTGHR
ncbi:MAG: tRNA (adenosine(37)-N6)-threonylcarbamoyltransferase complex ATPase subunit type 1 TsaE [Syntrophomonadaceae bacterium]|nr:tRNA (adenosine(37)-N6)-threonylcarbamoyltransferase complex ATPase subunit type 1 TsaE [Syntrophomonadaceae bacterium]